MRMGVLLNDGPALEAWLNDVFKRWRFANIRFENEMPVKYIYVLSQLDQIKKIKLKQAIPLRLMLLAFQVPEIESLHRLAGNVIRTVMSLFYTDFFNKEIAAEFFKSVAEWMTDNIEALRLCDNIYVSRNTGDLDLYNNQLQIMAVFYEQQQMVLKTRINSDRISLLHRMFDTTKKVTIKNFEKYQWRLASFILEKSQFKEADKLALSELQRRYAESKGFTSRVAAAHTEIKDAPGPCP